MDRLFLVCLNYFVFRILSDNPELLNNPHDDEADRDSSLDEEHDEVAEDEGSCNLDDCNGDANKMLNRSRKRRKVV